MITWENFLFRFHFWDLVKSNYSSAEISNFTGWSIQYVNQKKKNRGRKPQWHWSGSALLKAYQRKNRREWLSTEYTLAKK